MNDRAVNANGAYVLYWMIAARRTRSSFALDRAVAWSHELGKPLVVLEPLAVDYPWASDRLHRFVLDGMADNARRFEKAGILHHPYVERAAGEGRGLLTALAADACVVVTDEFPAFFLPRLVAAAGRAVAVALEQVDGNGLVPLRAPGHAFVTARAFRRWLRENLDRHLARSPKVDPLRAARAGAPPLLPRAILRRWPRASARLLAGAASELAALPIDHRVEPVAFRGGGEAARATLRAFVANALDRYAAEHRHPDAGVTSGLSPYLHFGHVSSHEIHAAVARHEGDARANADAFLEQLVTWRELGLNMCAYRDDYAEYDSLPWWARRTLQAHAADPRPVLYTFDELESARTHDPLWNAAQTQLLRDGRIHNYLRMLWGKKILEWSPSPEEALRAMIRLNDRWALDGRDPNSYSGIFWVLGRYDRPWGPERPIFGLVRYMTSASTARKIHVKEYVARWAV